MNIGALNRRFRFEKRSVTADADYGTPTGAWSEVCTVWVNVLDGVPGNAESQANGIRIAQRPARVRMRYREDITSDMRAIDITRGSRMLKLLTPPAEVGRKNWIEFMVADFSASGEGA